MGSPFDRRGVTRELVFVVVLVVLALGVAGCGTDGADSSPQASGGSSGERVEADGFGFLSWGRGERGVVLVHGAAYDAASWRAQATRIADAGVAVLAVEKTSDESLLAAVDYLTKEQGATTVTLLGASAGGAAVIGTAAANPRAYDQLVLLSPAGGDVSQLGDAPKLFVYSRGESLADSVERQAADAPGEDNDVLAVDGDAHAQAIFGTDQGTRVTEAIIDRLTGP